MWALTDRFRPTVTLAPAAITARETMSTSVPAKVMSKAAPRPGPRLTVSAFTSTVLFAVACMVMSPVVVTVVLPCTSTMAVGSNSVQATPKPVLSGRAMASVSAMAVMLKAPRASIVEPLPTVTVAVAYDRLTAAIRLLTGLRKMSS